MQQTNEEFDLICGRCGAGFASPYPTKRYCTPTCREAAREKRRIARNPEREREARRRQTRDPDRRDKRLARDRVYYETHREAILARARAEYAANPSPKRTQAQAWREANPDLISEYRRRAASRSRSTPRYQIASTEDWAAWEADIVARREAKARLSDPEYAAAWKAVQTRRKVLGRSALTPEQYNAMLEAQGGVCKICGKPETRVHHVTGLIVALAIDHDHRTGDIRGLLCFNCNAALGKFNDDPGLLAVAMAYLTPRLAKGLAA